jgi:multiple sugar transport system ATP-binding protein
MASVDFEHIDKEYVGGHVAVSGVDLHVEDGELMVFVGPSGCGKSTLLRILAGLETVTRGTIRIGDRVVNDLSPQERNVAMVFQDYALYPHMTVRRNLEFPLRMRKLASVEMDKKVQWAAGLLNLSQKLDRLPKQLSGGERQRVAMGRALVREPTVFLLDEPLSNLDAKLRGEVRAEIAELQRRTGTTMIYVTHDQVEAMTLGHRITVLDRGRIQQVDTPRALYERPANVFVAGFIGNPPMNLLPASLVSDDPKHAKMTAGVRAEALSLAEDAASGRVLSGTVEHVENLGHEILARVVLPFRPYDVHLLLRLPADRNIKPRDPVRIHVDVGRVHYFES